MVMSLLLLVVMTMLAVTAMRGTLLQEQMVGGMEDHHRALEAAEAALHAAEQRIENGNTAGEGYYERGDGHDRPDWLAPAAEHDVADAFTHAPGYLVDKLGNERLPRYIIEYIGTAEDAEGLPPGRAVDATEWDEQREGGELYRVRALGLGARDGTAVVLESLYRTGS